MPKHIRGYPRPQFVRENWQSLNGNWAFAFDDENLGERESWYHNFPAQRDILVPFTYETKASGIGEESFHPVVWYEKNVVLQPGEDAALLLHFEASDYQTKVWVNGAVAGEHRGGYTRFSFNISHLVQKGSNSIVVRVQDSFDTQQPRGKQRWKNENFGCWYVQTTGIWRTVWLEEVPETRLESIKMTPHLDGARLAVEWAMAGSAEASDLILRTDVSFDGMPLNSVTVAVAGARGSFDIDMYNAEISQWGIRTWTPETPDLYDIRFTLTAGGSPVDEVDSYFGMREIRIENGRVLLNGRPYYQRLILDQGYWEDSHLTPPDEDALIEDVEKTLALGFNGARKHQKVEDELYYYWCDVKGLLVWSEMPSTFTYGDDAVTNFMDEWQNIVKMHYNHPCVITWTPVNESWGVSHVAINRMQQHFTEAVYHLTKSLDATRPVIVNDGWEHTVSDILTLHDYEESGEAFYDRYAQNAEKILSGEIYHNKAKRAFAGGYGYRGQPVILSEYGGAAFENKASGAWGYGNSVKTTDDLLKRIDSMTTAIKKLPYVCGYCYTQLTDVQQEVNGLLDMQRRPKAKVEEISEIFTRPVNPEY